MNSMKLHPKNPFTGVFLMSKLSSGLLMLKKNPRTTSGDFSRNRNLRRDAVFADDTLTVRKHEGLHNRRQIFLNLKYFFLYL